MVCWAGTDHCGTAWLRAHYCLAVGIFAGGTKHRTRTYSCGPRIRYGCDSLEPTGRRTAYRTVSTRKRFEWRWTTAGYERTSGIFSVLHRAKLEHSGRVGQGCKGDWSLFGTGRFELGGEPAGGIVIDYWREQDPATRRQFVCTRFCHSE